MRAVAEHRVAARAGAGLLWCSAVVRGGVVGDSSIASRITSRSLSCASTDVSAATRPDSPDIAAGAANLPRLVGVQAVEQSAERVAVHLWRLRRLRRPRR